MNMNNAKPFGYSLLDFDYYMRFIDIFCETGEVPPADIDLDSDEPFKQYEDPLLNYIRGHASNPLLRLQILSSNICREAYRNVMGQFIFEILKFEQFERSAHLSQWEQAEKMKDWSLQKRKANGNALLTRLEQKLEDDGFKKGEYKNLGDDANWERLTNDVQKSLRNRSEKKLTEQIKLKSRPIDMKYQNDVEILRSISEYYKMSEEEIGDAIKIYNGGWTAKEARQAVLLYKSAHKDPVIDEILSFMGRSTNEFGKRKLNLSKDGEIIVNHSSGSDIVGITIGKQLHSIMPAEMALFSDSQLEAIFLKKFLTGNLQVFNHQSKMGHSPQQIGSNSAISKGPMIICVDTSDSMSWYMDDIHDLISHLAFLAEKMKKKCLLISFSVNIVIVDLTEERRKQRANSYGRCQKGLSLPELCGGTDVTELLSEVNNLLNSSRNYTNADVLLISDFRIPQPSADTLSMIENNQKRGVWYLGLNMYGDIPEWCSIFNKIWKL